MKPFRLSRRDRKVAGVLGGLATAWGWDASWVRLAFVVLCLATGFFPCVAGYLLVWAVVDREAEAD